MFEIVVGLQQSHEHAEAESTAAIAHQITAVRPKGWDGGKMVVVVVVVNATLCVR